MGCTNSVHVLGKKSKKKRIPEVVVFVSSIRFPIQSDLHRAIKGLVPTDLADKISSLRNQIVLLAEDTSTQRLYFYDIKSKVY